MSKLNNRYPKKDQSKLMDGSAISAKYNPKTENSPRAWEKFLNQEKYQDIVWEESNIPVYNELIKKKKV
jgi:hypothetical protein|tara:strand:+ start:362 stop:568 length:207 start_codon:yes stop_codon:yes gene_type:complete